MMIDIKQTQFYHKKVAVIFRMIDMTFFDLIKKDFDQRYETLLDYITEQTITPNEVSPYIPIVHSTERSVYKDQLDETYHEICSELIDDAMKYLDTQVEQVRANLYNYNPTPSHEKLSVGI